MKIKLGVTSFSILTKPNNYRVTFSHCFIFSIHKTGNLLNQQHSSVLSIISKTNNLKSFGTDKACSQITSS